MINTRKNYITPEAELITFNYKEQVVASGQSGHYDSNGKWHAGGNGNKHVDGINYDVHPGGPRGNQH